MINFDTDVCVYRTCAFLTFAYVYTIFSKNKFYTYEISFKPMFRHFAKEIIHFIFRKMLKIFLLLNNKNI